MIPKIDFMIIGAQKAGSTSLYDYLTAHPDVFMPGLKDGHFFSDDDEYRQLNEVLQRVYRGSTDFRSRGGGDVLLIFKPHSISRLLAHNPEMKLLAILRNPVDRAYSAYWHARQLTWEKAATFEEALEAEPPEGSEALAAKPWRAYVNRGHYFEQLTACLQHTSADRLKVLLLDDMKSDPAGTVAETWSWLGLDPARGSANFGKRSNPASVPRIPWLHRFFWGPGWHKRIYRRMVPRGLRYGLRERLLRPMIDRNLKPLNYPPINPDTRKRLAEHFRPHNRRLAEMLGRNLNHWQ